MKCCDLVLGVQPRGLGMSSAERFQFNEPTSGYVFRIAESTREIDAQTCQQNKAKATAADDRTTKVKRETKRQ
jgi:hypothetical protein